MERFTLVPTPFLPTQPFQSAIPPWKSAPALKALVASPCAQKIKMLLPTPNRTTAQCCITNSTPCLSSSVSVLVRRLRFHKRMTPTYQRVVGYRHIGQMTYYAQQNCGTFFINNTPGTVTYDYWDFGGTTQWLNGACFIGKHNNFGGCSFGVGFESSAYIASVVLFLFCSRAKLNQLSP
jgi:hypothetical protein